MIDNNVVLEYTEQKTENLNWPHNDALVLEIRLADCKITRTMVDTDSSVKVFYKDTLENMKLHDLKARPPRNL